MLFLAHVQPRTLQDAAVTRSESGCNLSRVLRSVSDSLTVTIDSMNIQTRKSNVTTSSRLASRRLPGNIVRGKQMDW